MNTYQACKTLDVNEDASFEEVKYAYRKLALHLHPDKNKGERDGTKFKEITAAYHHLKNNQKRLNSSQSSKTWSYKDDKTKKQTFTGKKTWWGAGPKGSPPEEDWSKYTKDFEEDQGFWQRYEKEFWEKYDAWIKANEQKEAEFKKKRWREPEPDLTITVDPSLCIACCSCETIAPDVFIVDRLTKLNPKSRVHNEKGAGYNKIMDAAQTCPTKAILVDEKDTGKRLYPW